jgi:hypothetical protein
LIPKIDDLPLQLAKIKIISIVDATWGFTHTLNKEASALATFWYTTIMTWGAETVGLFAHLKLQLAFQINPILWRLSKMIVDKNDETDKLLRWDPKRRNS